MKTALAGAALLGFLAVAGGAFGAHALEERLDAEALDWWRTGAGYALAHAVAALAAAEAKRRTAAFCFIAGAGVFTGSLWAMALGAPRLLGAVTPIGGVLMLAGWALVFIAAIKREGD